MKWLLAVMLLTLVPSAAVAVGDIHDCRFEPVPIAKLRGSKGILDAAVCSMYDVLFISYVFPYASTKAYFAIECLGQYVRVTYLRGDSGNRDLFPLGLHKQTGVLRAACKVLAMEKTE